MKKVYFLGLLFVSFFIFGCTQSTESTVTSQPELPVLNVISFDEGLAQLGQISLDFNIVNNTIPPTDAQILDGYKNKLIEFKDSLSKYENDSNKTILLELTGVYIASSEVMKKNTPEVSSFITRYDTNSDLANICATNDLVKLDESLFDLTTATLVMNQKIIEFNTKYPAESKMAELPQADVYDISGGQYLFAYKYEPKLLQKICTALDDMNTQYVLFDSLAIDPLVCSKTTQVRETRDQLVLDMNIIQKISNTLISTSKEYSLDAPTDVEQYAAQIEISKQTIADATQQLLDSC